MEENKQVKLNIGSGRKPIEGYINIDRNPNVNPDIVRDVERGLPFGDNTVDIIYTEHFMEHVEPDLIDFIMFEVWRVLKHKGEFRCIVPINRSLMGSPYHKSFWNEFTPIFFTEWNKREDTGYDFNLLHKQITASPNIYNEQFLFILEAVKETNVKVEDSKTVFKALGIEEKEAEEIGKK